MFIVSIVTVQGMSGTYSRDIPTVEEGKMKKTSSNSRLTARINRFMDRKISLKIDASDLDERESRRTRRQLSEVSVGAYIPLAIK